MIGNINPDGRQNEVVALPPKGHYVVLGTAGSGKTTMALLRALFLSNLPKRPKVLVVTFNRALVEYMGVISGGVPQNIKIENFHKFARGYLNSRGKMPRRGGIVDDKGQLVQEALDGARKEHPEESTFKRPLLTFLDEITFLECFGITTLEEYLAMERIGRAAAYIKRENRKWFFEVYQRYLQIRAKKNLCYDWDDLALYTYQELQRDTSARMYSHIVVDEGQDFSPVMLRALTSAVAPDGSFTFFGDVAQQIYGSRLSWRDSGIQIGDNKVWRFDKNYRNPSTIVEFANDIITSPLWDDDEDMVVPSESIAQGPKPVLIRFSNDEREMEWLAAQIKQNVRTTSNVVICRNRSTVNFIAHKLQEHDIAVSVINKEQAGFADVKGVYISTFHAAKGLEFENVFIPFLKQGVLPDPDVLNGAPSEEGVLSDELKLLYVAVTRSKYGLFMSYHGALSPLFPSETTRCDYIEGETLL